MERSTNESGGKSQLEKFKYAARELARDDDERHFGERLGKLLKAAKDGENEAK